MKQVSHVTKEQLLAFRDGEQDDLWIREHLATCEKCQRRYDDSRWSLSLQRSPASLEEGHPSSEELTAFWDNALSSESAQRIQSHLRSCNHCLAAYRRMRGIEPGLAYASPAPDLVRRVREQFSTRPPAIELEDLWLNWVGGFLELTRERRERGAWLEQQSLSCARSAERLQASDTHPASARARRERFAPTRKPEQGKPIRLEAGTVRVELRVVDEGDEAVLGVGLSWVDTDEPAGGVRLIAQGGDAGQDEAVTGEDGSACVRLWGTTRLFILTPTHVALKINSAV